MFDINKILTDVKDTQLKRLEEINHKIKQEQLKMDPTGKSSANSFTTQLTNEVSKYLKTFPGNTPEPEPEPEQGIEGDKRDKGENGEKGKKETKKKNQTIIIIKVLLHLKHHLNFPSVI